MIYNYKTEDEGVIKAVEENKKLDNEFLGNINYVIKKHLKGLVPKHVKPDVYKIFSQWCWHGFRVYNNDFTCPDGFKIENDMLVATTEETKKELKKIENSIPSNEEKEKNYKDANIPEDLVYEQTILIEDGVYYFRVPKKLDDRFFKIYKSEIVAVGKRLGIKVR
ncbi:hypothetical protein [Methanococcus voltae]|uniref:Uncharacterized protein n=1 Tax=Methanococcus voltae (strain ATCC BAA-1334 / A3) TaxID=456320 RepID=D7DSM5_METV3|nr:hypothetical protein [Methanococcus voltae]MCS3901734.1 hypothetical protein [Methanococcus voltae]